MAIRSMLATSGAGISVVRMAFMPLGKGMDGIAEMSCIWDWAKGTAWDMDAMAP